MTTLHQWLAAQKSKHCELCGVAILVGAINFALFAAYWATHQ